MGFTKFKFHSSILQAVTDQGFTVPTPVQQKSMSHILEGKDVLALAQTGTGKTAAFALPILQKQTKGCHKNISTLVVAPTRELAEQISGEFKKLGKHTRATTLAVYGGLSKKRQIDQLSKGVDILVACPGRLLDIATDMRLDFSHLDTLVLDEADMMLDMGFLPDIKRILKLLPKKRQTLLFSATMPKEISGLANQILRNPETIQIDFEKPLNTVAHALYPVAQHLKGKFLQVLLKELHMNSALIFTRTKARAKRLGLQLTKAGYAATSLQGNMSQSQRSRSLDGFRSGKYQILVATDIAARGIDISDISHVINFDIPDTVEAYVHRIGRTGRAAKNGDAFTLVTDDDKQLVGRIEKKIGMRIEKRTIEEFDYTAAPIKNGPQQGRRPAVRHKRADKPLETAGKVVDGVKKTRQAGNAKAKINAKSKAKRNRRYASR